MKLEPYDASIINTLTEICYVANATHTFLFTLFLWFCLGNHTADIYW